MNKEVVWIICNIIRIFDLQEITLWRKGEKLKNTPIVPHGPSHLVAMEGGPKGSEPLRYDAVSSPSEDTKNEEDAISPTTGD